MKNTLKQKNTPKILLIEDHPDIVEMYKIAFRNKGGFELYTAFDKTVGLEMIRKIKPDLLLLDIIIPEKENAGFHADSRYGFEVLEEVRKDPKIKNLKVLLLTNLDTPKDRARARNLRALDYVVKASVMPYDVVKMSLKTIGA